jgi:hypothetical protein
VTGQKKYLWILPIGEALLQAEISSVNREKKTAKIYRQILVTMSSRHYPCVIQQTATAISMILIIEIVHIVTSDFHVELFLVYLFNMFEIFDF